MPDKNSTTAEKLGSLRLQFNAMGVDGFLVPRSDEYQGEYVAPYAERMKWISGFSGSAGVAIVLRDKAVVMTDGRYLIQVKNEVDPICFDTADITKISAGRWLADHADQDAVIGYDPKLHTPVQIEAIEKIASGRGITLKALDSNLVDLVWDDQPAPPMGVVELFPAQSAGLTLKEKKALVLDAVKAAGAHGMALTMPDSICWLLNVRGGDVDYTPVVLSALLVNAEKDALEWFVDAGKINPAVRAALAADVVFADPADLDARLAALAAGAVAAARPVLLDLARSSVYFKAALENGGAQVKDIKDPCIDPRAQKTQAEQDAVRAAHMSDGAAMAKFLHWLDGIGPQSGENEISVAKKLEAFRQQGAGYRGPSFATISGFAGNGAIIHYHATPATNRDIDKDGLLLVDSGGQYEWGTTDITRTVAIGTPSEDMKDSFTRVLRGHIALAMAQFPKGTTGGHLDGLARQFLRSAQMDYDHGTGHGVGCYLSVHEEAASISPRGKDVVLPGMLLSNEPGFYLPDHYGIRIENLILAKEGAVRRDTGDLMLSFETVTYAPISKKLIQSGMLSAEEKSWLNAYHAEVYAKIAPALDQPVRDWLKDATAPLL